jgi:hypothetical protein
MIVELKYNENGTCHFEAYGFQSLPFDLKDMRVNKDLFMSLIKTPVVGTVQ